MTVHKFIVQVRFEFVSDYASHIYTYPEKLLLKNK